MELMYGVKIVLQTSAVIPIKVRPRRAFLDLVALAKARVRVPLLNVALLQAPGPVVRVGTLAAAVGRVVPLQMVAVLLADATLALAADVLLDERHVTILKL